MDMQQLDIFQSVSPDPSEPFDYLASHESVFRLLQHWQALDWLRSLDNVFAQFISSLYPSASPLFVLAAALVSHQQGRGHVCLLLDETLSHPDFALSLPPEGNGRIIQPLLPSTVLRQVTLEQWLQQIEQALAFSTQQPLHLNGTRLYTQRFWQYEQQLAASLKQRMGQAKTQPENLTELLHRLFSVKSVINGQPVVDWQKIACALASQQFFTLITGGPGTGKTTTVVRLLALLQQVALQHNPKQPLRIQLAAPTGKAAARLTESIGAQIEQLPIAAEVKQQIPKEVLTLHRLLGSQPESRAFRHNQDNLLMLDVLVIDEASMIDLEMMYNVLQALPVHAQLILLGDKNQLASVEAGAVLGDLCHFAEQGYYAPELIEQLSATTGEPIASEGLVSGQHLLAQHTVMLRHSRRFFADSEIGQLATAVNQAEATQAEQLLIRPSNQELLHLSAISSNELLKFVINGVASGNSQRLGYAYYLEQLKAKRPDKACSDVSQWQQWSAEVLNDFSQFQLLAAVRKGEYGVEQLNQRIAERLAKMQLIHQPYGWYEGRPVLITQNDYSLGLMNGDVGIALYVPTFTQQGRVSEGLSLRVAFAKNDGSGAVRWLLPSRLSAVETVFAMTVHKSQGSEFTHTALILPEQLNPVLTKELVYTAITRAKQKFSLIEPVRGVFSQAIQRSVKRNSGLLEAILND